MKVVILIKLVYFGGNDCLSLELKDYKKIVAKLFLKAGLSGSVGCASDWFDPRQGRQHSFMEIHHELFSMVILSLPLIQEGQLSVSGERMGTILVNCLEDFEACPVKVWLGKLTMFDMTPPV